MFVRLARWLCGTSAAAPTRKTRSRRPLSLEALELRTLLSGPEITVLDGNVAITSGSAAVIDFGTVGRGDTGPTHKFTVRNDGDSPLALDSLSLPTGFSLVDAPNTFLVPRSSDTFTIRLDSASVGTRTGYIGIGSNDADESIFVFSVSGTVTANGPEINILLGDTPIVDGTEAIVPWPGVVIGDTGPVRTFTIKNNGNQPLAVSGINYPGGFALVGSLPASIAPQASDIFKIRLLSATTGLKSGQVHIFSNDPDIASFDFPISGLVTATPVPSLTLIQGTTVLTSETSTVNFGKAVKDKTGPSRTFVVRNDGTADLSLEDLDLPDGFDLINGLVSSLDPAESDSFIVQLDTSTIAEREGDITIESNDPAQDLFEVHVTGNVVANAPEIRVFRDEDELTSGSGEAVEFDSVVQGKQGSIVTFSVANFGVKELTLGNVTVPAGFKLLSGLPPKLPPDTFSVMVVQLDGKEPGTKSGEISFSTNDDDENPFRIQVTGAVQAPGPEIVVTQQKRKVTDGSPTPIEFDDGHIGEPGPTLTFTVRNQGRGTLTLGALTVPDGFTVVEGLPSTLAPRASDTFTVQLDTSALGEYSGEITLATNDSDENPFNFSIEARVVPAPVPQIVVLQGKTVLESDDATVIDFGSIAFGKKGKGIKLTIRNDGEADLDLVDIELPSGFTLAKPSAQRVAAGRSATLQLRLDSQTLGFHSGQLIIESNDDTVPSFIVTLEGTVI